ncbi:hypothetical protein [Micromonospora sp. NBC_01813]|uniref:hypothetical protein n=1 Tax=Micromonospora sp. NBC_01813 TaxID=2975988 RepID=UPI002DDC04D9|nr:hypothetical protein [Micromonospora sp. NBC_01813]WSA09112.1 hypothetical protein OG958_34050 [Micromonospora sp. NBC_01813]
MTTTDTDSLDRHRERAADLLRQARFDDEGISRLSRDVLPTLSSEDALSFLVVLVQRASAYRGRAWRGSRLIVQLGRRSLPWTAADVTLAFEFAAVADHRTAVTLLKVAVNSAERLDPTDRSACLENFELALRQVDGDWPDSAGRAHLRSRVRALIGSARAS